MNKSKPNILVITPIKHIKGMVKTLQSFSNIFCLDDPLETEVSDVIQSIDAIFTNPNKSKVFLGKNILKKASKLKVICTASTGTNHIDKAFLREKNITLISLTEERHIIDKFSSTAELAFGLTLSGIRHIVNSHNDVMRGNWDYSKFIGRQMNFLTIGVIGYGRLGQMYAKYCRAFGSKVLIFDPYKKVNDKNFVQINSLHEICSISDILSIHVHTSDETIGMFDETIFKKVRKDVLIVNTSRGEIINEEDLIRFLKRNKQARVSTDVISNEVKNKENSNILKYAKISDQLIITPHIGGMSRESQEMAFNHAAILLKQFFSKK